MTVEIVSYEVKDGVVTIEAENCDEAHLQKLERIRDDYIQRMITFVFDTKEKNDLKYLRSFLKRQKRVKEAKPQTWGEALTAVIGSITTISSKYIDRAA